MHFRVKQCCSVKTAISNVLYVLTVERMSKVNRIRRSFTDGLQLSTRHLVAGKKSTTKATLRSKILFRSHRDKNRGSF